MSVQNPGVTTGAGFTNKSGAIAAGTTSQVAIAANPSRKFLLIQNPSTASEPLYYEFDGVATIASTSPELAVGAAVIFDLITPVGSVNVNATTSAHKFFMLEG